MKQIPKREGAALNGYGLSVLSLALLLFLLPFASSLVINLGETVGNERTQSLHDFQVLNASSDYLGMPNSGSWISSGDSPNAVCDEVENTSISTAPFGECESYSISRGSAHPTQLGGFTIGYYADEIGSYTASNGCADNSNSSISCGNNNFKMRFHDVTFDYSSDVISDFRFTILNSNVPDPNKMCSDTHNAPLGANISVDYRVDFEIWEQNRITPTSPEYWVRNKTIEGFEGINYEFYNLEDFSSGGSNFCFNKFEIKHELDFADSQRWNSQVLDQLDEPILNIYGQPKNQTVAFVISWDDVRNADRDVPLSRSSVILPYEALNNVLLISSVQFDSYEVEYWNAATNTLTLILGVVFALTAFASTPFFNPTKSRIIDRLRDA